MPRHRKHSEDRSQGQSSGHGHRRKHSGERRRKHSSDDAAQAEQPSASADALQRPRLSKQLSDSLKRFLPKSGHDARDRRADDFLARLEAAEKRDSEAEATQPRPSGSPEIRRNVAKAAVGAKLAAAVAAKKKQRRDSKEVNPPPRPRLSKQLSDSLKSVLGGGGRDSEEAAPPPRPRLSKRASDSLKSVLGGSGRILDPTFERRSVRLSGLSQTRLNGRVGTVVSLNHARGRYNVELQGSDAKVVALLPSKLELLADAATSPIPSAAASPKPPAFTKVAPAAAVAVPARAAPQVVAEPLYPPAFAPAAPAAPAAVVLGKAAKAATDDATVAAMLAIDNPVNASPERPTRVVDCGPGWRVVERGEDHRRHGDNRATSTTEAVAQSQALEELVVTGAAAGYATLPAQGGGGGGGGGSGLLGLAGSLASGVRRASASSALEAMRGSGGSVLEAVVGGARKASGAAMDALRLDDLAERATDVAGRATEAAAAAKDSVSGACASLAQDTSLSEIAGGVGDAISSKVSDLGLSDGVAELSKGVGAAGYLGIEYGERLGR